MMPFYSFLQNSVGAQSSIQVSILSQGTINYYSSLNVNLALIPDCWHLTYGTGPQIIFLDHDITHNGHPSIRLEPHVEGVDMNRYRECDGTWYHVKPGDHIVAKCWIYVGKSGMGDDISYHGGRLGMDFYAHTSIGEGIVDSYPHAGQEHVDSVVPWGTEVWTQKVWDIIIPSTKYTQVHFGDTNRHDCDPVQIDSMVLWFDVREPDDSGFVWFADAEFYINPA
jgi:hypothetical protein